MWRRCGIFQAAGSNFHILFEQIPYLRVDGLLPLRPVRDLQAIDIVQHGFLREHRGHGDEGALVGGQAADYVQFTPEHSKIPVLGNLIRGYRVGEGLGIRQTADHGKAGIHGTGHQRGDGNAGAFQLPPQGVGPTGNVGPLVA